MKFRIGFFDRSSNRAIDKAQFMFGIQSKGHSPFPTTVVVTVERFRDQDQTEIIKMVEKIRVQNGSDCS
ncbi:hypothetical protein LguiB_012539 [Lonicera macranthoides]